MRGNAQLLKLAGLGYWGPGRTRKGLFAGVIPSSRPAYVRDAAKRARGRIAMQMERSAANGVETLFVSEENMIGSAAANVRAGRLYPGVGERMARFNWAFGGRIDRVVLTIRSLEHWWTSAVAYGVARGVEVPNAQHLGSIATHPRGWREVITDIACAVPEAEICVLPFESFGGRPSVMLGAVADVVAPEPPKIDWLNRAPDLTDLHRVLADRGEAPGDLPEGSGRWQPFGADQLAAMKELYADDLFWLTSGADGLATLTEDPMKESWHASRVAWGNEVNRGRPHDTENRRLAHPGGG